MPAKASKLLERMRRSKAGWKRKDLESLYLGYGFIIKSGGKHDLVYHPEFPQLIAYLPRHTAVAKYLVATAIKRVEEYLRLSEAKENQDNGEH